jgi:osmotically-inducible protein OsmY
MSTLQRLYTEATPRTASPPSARRRTLIFGAIGLAIGGIGAFLLDPARGRRRRAQLVDQAAGLARRFGRRGIRLARMTGSRVSGMLAAATRGGEQPMPNDAALAEKVETVLFRDPHVPKGSLNINAEEGVVILRGEVPDVPMRDRLAERARRIRGVSEVRNLVHVGGSPPRST